MLAFTTFQSKKPLGGVEKVFPNAFQYGFRNLTYRKHQQTSRFLTIELFGMTNVKSISTTS